MQKLLSLVHFTGGMLIPQTIPVVFEHAQKFYASKIDCKQILPPVKDWMKNF